MNLMMKKYKIETTKKFRKDIKRLRNSGRFDLEKLNIVMRILGRGEILPDKYRNHSLWGRFAGTFECHIEPNWLLIYEKRDDILVLCLIRTGSHGDLF